MPKRITDSLKIDKKKFDKLGGFDALLDIDSKFFIEPRLLLSIQNEEFKSAAQKIKSTFKKVITHLGKSKRTDDNNWIRAKELFSFHEPVGIGIGYSKNSTSGRGLSGKNTEKILFAAKSIIDQGIKDTEIFELITIFSGKGIGIDFVSDMFASIIYDELLLYSENIFSKFNVPTQEIEYNNNIYNLPINPFNKKQIVIVPKHILKDIPISSKILSKNYSIRKQILQIIKGTASKKKNISKKKKNSKKIKVLPLHKNEIQNILMRNPSLLKNLIQTYKSIKAEAYDFNEDPTGEYLWYEISKEFCNNLPSLKNRIIVGQESSSFYKIILESCNHFKHLLENKNYFDILFDKNNNKPKPEGVVQRIFETAISLYLDKNNIDIAPESHTGRGSIDFKLSRGSNLKVLVELKLSHNNKILNGLSKQLMVYGKAEKTNMLVYIIIDFGTKHSKLTKFKEGLPAIKQEIKKLPEIIYVDASKKLTGSKL